ncbi:MAG: ATP-binding protein [Lachnospiraceae bacterium]|nr:ATP-binding protein [Lachnospiraceae bacterium]
MKKNRMPIGMDSFEKIRTGEYYYVDKTGFIRELLNNHGEVNLFTRPRRFGKSLNMSMLKSFFEIGTDQGLFESLAIMEEADMCKEYMGQFPVVSVSLKQVSGEKYERAENNVWDIVSMEARRISSMLDSEKLTGDDKWRLQQLIRKEGLLDSSLNVLSEILRKYYGKRVIILIDEYDAPLQNAFDKGYYESMVLLIRQMFGYALKSNESLEFAVLTGCMRISKESLFSDLNNPKIFSLVDDWCDEWFGFTDGEVRKLLADFGLDEYYQTTKDWYDGYRVGVTDVYCPWDVINWCDQILTTSDKMPRNYWANAGQNNIIYRFADMSEDADRYEMELLSQGGTVDKELSFELTYGDIYSSIDNLWSVLFTAGYLTQRGRNEDGTYRLSIPNRELLKVFAGQIQKWFMEKMEGGLQSFYRAFENGDAKEIEDCIDMCLKESISFMDGGNTEEQKESWYHAFVLGMAKGRRGWVVKSNREAGKGRADIILIERLKNKGIIIEVKHTDDAGKLKEKAEEACDQIRDTNYDEFFLGFSIGRIEEYGMAFSGKKCMVLKRMS